MTQVNINNQLVYQENISNIDSVSFFNLNQKIYSATKFQEIVGIFLSNILDGGDDFIRWESFYFEGNNDGIEIFIKNSDFKENLNKATWHGPYTNKINPINSLGRYLQFLIVIRDDGTKNGQIESLGLRLISSQDSVKFFTKSFDIGFSPEHILLSYNGTISEDSITRFYVSGENTSDLNKYYQIKPNKIESLKNFSLFSKNIKIMIEMIGNSKIPVEIDEFSLILSGDGYKKINKKQDLSSAPELDTDYNSSSSEVGGFVVGISSVK